MYYDYSNVKTGDIIFVYSGAKSSRLNVAGQSALRTYRRIFKGVPAPRYSHVMLVIDQSAVIHADGNSVRVQAIGDVLGPDITWGKFRVVRLAESQLTGDMAESIAGEARRFLRQRYTFGYGRSLLPKILRRGRGLTLPFCSQLVAIAYAKAGIRFGERPDLILPSDIDHACQPPVWEEVTDSYRRRDLKTVLSLEAFLPEEAQQIADVARLIENFAEFHEVATQSRARNPELTHDLIQSAFEMWKAKVTLAYRHTDTANVVEHDPMLMLATARDLVINDLAQIPMLYKRLGSKTLMLEDESLADLIRISFPGADRDFSPYEGIPTLAVIEELEQIASMLIASTLLRKLKHYLPLLAETAADSCGRSAPLPSVPANLIVEYLLALPPLGEGEKEKIIASFQLSPERKAMSDLAIFIVELHSRIVTQREQLLTVIQFLQVATAEERAEVISVWAGQ
ncbi:hypothetical protein I7G60_27980 [Sinorhizobium meliloti]|uniref:YiiX/YebB-like N1pC/P60 family cysteine hydrolase n=1 Tax=Rhizobium meliloti TaxID=382 RepID=UPI0002F1BF1B|nr:YiiX/YebB-like N1pC/P60 family cysteine hydrolase [Sinorhizobium meliloti]MDE3761841.1 hypothetical protein [Sinorhizobium meliloti]